MQLYVSLCLLCLGLASMSNAFSVGSNLFGKRATGPSCKRRQSSCVEGFTNSFQAFGNTIYRGQPFNLSPEAVNSLCDSVPSVKECLAQVGECGDHPLQQYYDSMDYLCNAENLALYAEINGSRCREGQNVVPRIMRTCMHNNNPALDDNCEGERAALSCFVSELSDMCSPQVGQLVEGFGDIQLRYICPNDK